MKTLNRDCPVCHGTQFKSLRFLVTDAKSNARRPGSHIEPADYEGLHLNMCLRCSQVFYSTVPADINSIYKETYRKKEEFDHPMKQSANFKKCVLWHSLLEKHLKPGASTLDVGCAEGFFVEFLRKKKLCAEGLEINDLSVEYGRQRSLKIHHCDLLELTKTDLMKSDSPGYDLIFSSGYLEHVLEPEKIILHCRSLLAPGGLLYIQTPDVFCPNRNHLSEFFPAEHFQTFSVETLSFLLGSCGFDVIEVHRDVLNSGMAIIAKMRAQVDAKLSYPSALAAENRLIEIYQEHQKLNTKSGDGSDSFRPVTTFLSHLWIRKNNIPLPAGLGKAALLELGASLILNLDMDLIWSFSAHLNELLASKGYLDG